MGSDRGIWIGRPGRRFAFDDMRLSEYLLAFPYCLPAIGRPAVKLAAGPDAMQRFEYQSPNSFFGAGRAHREQLRAAYGRLDPLIGRIAVEEMSQRGLRYVLTSIPLAWCGMWVGEMLGLVLLPLFVPACVMTTRECRSVLLGYSAPALLMLATHAAVANHYTRYNLVLIGPFSVAGMSWKEPYFALGIAAVWAVYGVVHFFTSSKKKAKSVMVGSPNPA